ncbi:hypothetical protein TPHA_0K00720 [Tetrapisispora phaffii CBS 4417]|uniref:Protein BOI2 n=1 Tax=Tetrapisispora phaffii (strain ATCC 24235 / CBS 4417 / NBRC 1672 / NRRL Y-8282 / UCD 70-5) TaxID=1071381 RepID=G8BZ78_TETPH|nr:hypothetical protein TPHA_0K00720 [Tetrapisispora phaffii CBS 4417]CCE65206.1 hypothetical protein TPHA_0K00720 [Tetrapisispora phaffii CBS 4417]
MDIREKNILLCCCGGQSGKRYIARHHLGTATVVMSYRKISGLSTGSAAVPGSTRNVTPGPIKSVEATNNKGARSLPIYIAINEYSKRMEDELDFRPGDKIQVLLDDEEYNDGWYFGRNLRTQEEGLYPAVFTQEIKMERKYPLTRAKSFKRSVSNDSISQQQQQQQQGANNSIMEDIDTALNDMSGDSSLGGVDESAQQQVEVSMITTTTALDTSSADNVGSGNLTPTHARDWSPSQVAAYFRSAGFSQDTAEKFEQHKISGPILLELELSYLKELDIDSFGVRFEVFKEIENIKNAMGASPEQVLQPVQSQQRTSDMYYQTSRTSSNSGQLMPPANFDTLSYAKDGLPTIERPSSARHVRNPSKSLDDLPSSNPSPGTESQNSGSNIRHSKIQRPMSTIVNSESTTFTKKDELPLPKSVSEVLSNNNSFASPRRAPKPPSYPSPVQPPKSPAPYGSRGDSGFQRRTSSKMIEEEYVEGDESYEKDDTFTAIMEKMTNLTGGSEEEEYSDLVDNEENIKSESSSIYTEAVGHLPQSTTQRGKADKRQSFIQSPNKAMFTNNAQKSSPGGKDSKEVSNFTSKILGASSPLRPPNRNNDYSSSPSGKNSKRRSLSAQDITVLDNNELEDSNNPKQRSVSEATKNKTMKKMPPNKLKSQTTAFTEGLRTIRVQDAMKDADCSGWMNKKGSGTVGVWKTRFFTLHGTRLSYFGNTTDSRERGLIDITGHRVVPAREDDKLVSLYAASTGKGRYCFKLIPPQPGSKKGLTFTQPKVHYFAVDNKEEMRTWMTHLIKTTIDIDTSVPVVSSYTTPTVSLNKAQEMLTEAREVNRIREEQTSMENDESRLLWDQQNADTSNTAHNIIISTSDNGSPSYIGSPVEKKPAGTTNSMSTPMLNKFNSRSMQGTEENDTKSSLSNTSSNNNNRTTVSSSMGFSSPYLLASGMSTPNIVRSNSLRAKEKITNISTSDIQEDKQDGYFNSEESNKFLSEINFNSASPLILHLLPLLPFKIIEFL